MSNATTIHHDDRLINIDVLGALKRRKWIGLVIGVIGATLTYAIVTAWPNTYTATATILNHFALNSVAGLGNTSRAR